MHPPRPRRRARLAAAAALAALSLHAPTAPAAPVTWAVDADGQWATPANWSTHALPTPSDDVTLDRPLGTYTISLPSGSQSVRSLSSNEHLAISGGALSLAAPSTVNGTLSLSAGSLTYPTTKADLAIGSSLPATFVQSGGTFDNLYSSGTTSTSVYLAKNVGSSASLSLSNTAQFSTANLVVADAGSATVTQTGGTLTAYRATFAQTAGVSASYALSAGTFATSGAIYAAYNGAVSITHSGGTVGPTGTTFFAYAAGSSASYSLSGTASLKGFETYVGNAGNTTFTQSGGTHSAGFLAVANQSTSTSAYTLSAGSLTATGITIAPSGGRGTFTQTGGTFSLSSTNPNLSPLRLGPNGALNLSGGSLSSSSPADAILNGPVTHSGGSLSLPNANLRLGTTASAAPSYSLSNTASLTAKSLTLGETTPATFTQSGGTATLTSLTISPTSRYTLSAGALLLDYTAPSPAPQLRSYLSTGLLAPAPSVPPTMRLAYIDSSQLPVSRWSTTTWSIPDSTTLLVTLTLTGDANLDGKVNADDVALIDRGFARHLSNWSDGDFNYDGQVTTADYLLIDTTYGQAQGFSPGFLTMRESQFGADYVSQLLATVPEPSSLTCLFAGSALLTLTRRRRSPIFPISTRR